MLNCCIATLCLADLGGGQSWESESGSQLPRPALNYSLELPLCKCNRWKKPSWDTVIYLSHPARLREKQGPAPFTATHYETHTSATWIWGSPILTWGIHLGDTKLVASMTERPVSDSMLIKSIFTWVGTMFYKKRETHFPLVAIPQSLPESLIKTFPEVEQKWLRRVGEGHWAGGSQTGRQEGCLLLETREWKWLGSLYNDFIIIFYR